MTKTASIAYSATFCTENVAIPLFLVAMLLFMSACKTNDTGKWLLCGIVLSISNLFRAVGLVFLIAFVIYIFVSINATVVKPYFEQSSWV